MFTLTQQLRKSPEIHRLHLVLVESSFHAPAAILFLAPAGEGYQQDLTAPRQRPNAAAGFTAIQLRVALLEMVSLFKLARADDFAAKSGLPVVAPQPAVSTPQGAGASTPARIKFIPAATLPRADGDRRRRTRHAAGGPDPAWTAF